MRGFKLSNVLKGWTSMETWAGETVLQEFELFDDEEYGLTPPGTPIFSDEAAQQVLASRPKT